MNNKIGFTIGKFAPFHKGHQYLIETGIKEMDEFFVIVYDTNLIDISSEKRAMWIKKLYPSVKIIFAKNPPSKYGMDDESIEIQMKYLLKILGDIRPTHFYSSEPYGKCVADYMKIVDRRVDTQRKNIPIHGSVIRDNLDENKDWLADIVYEDLIKEKNNE